MFSASRWFPLAIVLSALLGWLAATVLGDVAWLAGFTDTLKNAYLTALKMIIAPLIFFSLISGVFQLRESGGMGRLGAVTVSYYLLTSAIAVIVGLSIVFFIHPWTAYPPLTDIPPTDAVLIDAETGGIGHMLERVLLQMLDNPFAALANLNILGILTSALLIGLAGALVLPKTSALPGIVTDITAIIYRIAGWVISLLPIGLFAIAYQLSTNVDIGTLIALGHFAGVVIGATLFHGLVVLPLIAWWLTGRTPFQFLRAAYQPMFTAFVTSSSAATLPLSLSCAQERLGVSRPTASFVLPLGATVNMDGTALFEGIAVVFLAYMFNVPLDAPTIVIVFLVAMLASAGAPGIPSGSMAGLQTVLLAVGIPLEAIGLVLLIERPLDTIRTAVNVEGDLIGSTVAERWG